MEDSVGNVKVVCRFRPLNSKELDRSTALCVNFLNSHSVSLLSPAESSGTFTFDECFACDTAQETVYNLAAKPTIESVMEGFNGTIFAYGQTASGKTFTMTGPDIDNDELRGIVPRMVETVFEAISNSEEHIEFSVKVSYMEIYLEQIRDLLTPARVNLKVHEDRTRGVFIKDLTAHYVASQKEVYDYMKKGNSNREVGATNMNAGSSRSHAIFMMTIAQNNSLDYSAKTGKLYLVDLAGSEKVGKTGAEGKRLEEAKNINKSLTTLGLVIFSLTDDRSSHIPYRDSKLTRVLQDSLGGNSKTCLIITCSPSVYNASETLSTLRFGIRAKAIKNKAKVNREYTVAELKLMISKIKTETAVMSRRVATLENTLKTHGIEIPNIETSLSDSYYQDEDRSSEYEVIQELEDTRRMLTEAVEDSQRTRNDLEQASIALEEIVATCGDHPVIISELKAALEAMERELLEKNEDLEQLRAEKENLETELGKLDGQVLALGQELTDKTIELEVVKAQAAVPPVFQQQSSPLSPEKTDHSPLLQENQRLSAENAQLKTELNSLLETNVPGLDSIKLIIQEEEKRKWHQEKRNYRKAVENKVKEYISTFEFQLNDAKENYRKLEQAMTDGEKFLTIRNEAMEKNLKNVREMHKDLNNKKNKLKAERTHFYKRCLRLEETLKDQQEKTKELERKLEIAVKLNEDARREEKKTIFDTKLRKTIRGGYKHLDSILKSN